MELSKLLFEQLISMMLIICMGIILVKTKIIKKEDGRILSAITLYVINPCMIISSLQIDYTKEKLDGILLAFFAAVAIHLVFIAVSHVLAKIFKLDAIERSSLIYSNGGNLIVPLVLALLGEEYIFYCCAYIMVQTIFFWIHLVRVIGGNDQASIKKIVTNPNMIAMAIGIFLFVTQIKLPTILANTASSMVSIVGPVCMLMLGIIMAGTDVKKTFLSYKNWLVCFGRLMFLPFLTVLLIKLTGVYNIIPNGKDVLMIFFLAVCAPVGVTVTQMSALFKKDEQKAGSINVMSVTFSMATMPIMLLLYQNLI